MRTRSSVPGVLILALLPAVVLGGCAYQQRETIMHPAPPALTKGAEPPQDLWTVQIVGAELPEYKGQGLPWDSDGTLPDPFVRLYVNKRLVWESPVLENTRKPEWNITLPRNVEIGEDSIFRLELKDQDSAASADPAGSIERTGLPEAALPDAPARLMLDNLGSITMIVSAPRAQQGVGLHFEVHPDALVVLDVERYSPAARAGILKGERIVAIGGKRVSTLSGDAATSALSLANDRGTVLTVTGEHGPEREVTLDKGFIWLVM